MAIKRQQCDMVMRLYFRAVADASVVVASRLVSLWDKRRLLETGGRFCQSSKEVLWLQYSVSPASDHLSCVDPVNFPQWSYICIALARFKYSLDSLGDVCLIPRYVGHINGQMFCDCSWFQWIADTGSAFRPMLFLFLNGHHNFLFSFYGPLWNVLYLGGRFEWRDTLEQNFPIALRLNPKNIWYFELVFNNFLSYNTFSYLLCSVVKNWRLSALHPDWGTPGMAQHDEKYESYQSY